MISQPDMPTVKFRPNGSIQLGALNRVDIRKFSNQIPVKTNLLKFIKKATAINKDQVRKPLLRQNILNNSFCLSTLPANPKCIKEADPIT